METLSESDLVLEQKYYQKIRQVGKGSAIQKQLINNTVNTERERKLSLFLFIIKALNMTRIIFCNDKG
jgi:hypothetical protein